ncbi:hypothetical protein GCM10009836_69730 [Pseudonocardia ailaonensis]|uniref:Alpha/beta hydrolase fold-3 domain-containing protein n=1 Tax=Pseudonocardia ailaonensis TaxID=367279 RepID=A0ABN2NP30_9PSEU
MRLTLPAGAVRTATRLLVAPALSPRLPLRVSRALLDAQGLVCPVPRGTRTTPSSLAGVPSVRVSGPGTPGPHVVLHLHGGGYALGSPRSHRSLGAWLAEAAGAPVELLDYRLAPEHPYPAGLDDAEAAYTALLDAGLSPQRIALTGDSAGAGLAMSLLLRLRGKGTPLPATVGLISPWLDLDLTDPALARNAGRDAMLGPALLEAGKDWYLRGGEATDPLLRPLEADLSGLPPIHVVAGSDEVLVGDADQLAERVRATGGVLTYTRSPGMWHDHVVEAGLLARGHEDLRDLGAALRRDCAARRVRVAVVGAGFGGIGMGAALHRHPDLAGLTDVTVLEKADSPGGVWRDNTYPGAACDVPSDLYSYSFAPGEWSRRFAPQPDILRYLGDVAADHGLTDAIRLGTEVTAATWDDAAATWRIETSGGPLEADVLVPACGQLSRPAVPDLPGIGDFRGPVFHSARWDHAVDLRGKRVAVVGTGASAIQFVPAIADDAEHVTVFQRSAPYLIPKLDGAYTRSRFPLWRKVSRRFWTAFFEFGALGFTAVRPFAASFTVLHHALLRLQVPDAGLRTRLGPDYPVGCKRVLISSDWFRALARPDVDVVTEKIVEVTADGIRTGDGRLHEADAIVFGTGFRSQDYLAPMRVVGRGGRELSEEWRGGARAHLGITVPGFPNLFLLYGPNTNLGSGSIVHMLECQIRYTCEGIRRLAAGTRSLEVSPRAASVYDTEMQSRLTESVWSECTSWYRAPASGQAGPGDGRITNNWPGTMREYRRRTEALDDREYLADRLADRPVDHPSGPTPTRT